MELDANWVCDIDSREVFITYFFYLYIGLWIFSGYLVTRRISRNDSLMGNLGPIIFFGFITHTTVCILYYFGTIEVKKIRFLSPGALMTTFLFFTTTYFFGIYIDNFSSYNQFRHLMTSSIFLSQ